MKDRPKQPAGYIGIDLFVRAISMRQEGMGMRYRFENGKWTDHVIYAATRKMSGWKL